MAAASIFVLSSRFEGFPLVLLEAMSKGMAVVAFDCPTGPADIIEDHANGLIVPLKDLDALAAAHQGDDRRRGAAAALRGGGDRDGEPLHDGSDRPELGRAAREPRAAGRGRGR